MCVEEKAFKSQKWCSWQGTSAPSKQRFFVIVEQITLICMDILLVTCRMQRHWGWTSQSSWDQVPFRGSCCALCQGLCHIMPFWHQRKCLNINLNEKIVYHWVAVHRSSRVMTGHDGSWRVMAGHGGSWPAGLMSPKLLCVMWYF